MNSRKSSLGFGNNGKFYTEESPFVNENEIHGDQIFSIIVPKLRAAGCVFAEEEARLLIASARTATDLSRMVEQRTTGLPLEYVIGWAEFCGTRIAVDQGVFVPRQRTAFLVQEAAALVRSGAIVLDLCCGSGAVGAVLASTEQIELYASDIDPVAVQCARRNVTAVGGLVYEGDLYEPLPRALRGRVNVLVANAPYVPTKAIELLPPEARIYEARLALDGGTDGLDVQRRIVASAPLWLAPGGHLLIETSERQSSQTVEIITFNGLIPHVTSSDELDATVVIGTKPFP
ncbi:MAG: methylase [Brevibacillus sp.]|nr:methylase [Brevibacillus sp.]